MAYKKSEPILKCFPIFEVRKNKSYDNKVHLLDNEVTLNLHSTVKFLKKSMTSETASSVVNKCGTFISRRQVSDKCLRSNKGWNAWHIMQKLSRRWKQEDGRKVG